VFSHSIKRALLLGCACALFVAGGLSFAWPTSAQIVVDRVTLPADGHATASARVQWLNRWGGAALWPRGPAAQAGLKVGAQSIALGCSNMTAHDGQKVLRAGHQAGEVTLYHPNAPPVQVSLRRHTADQDRDGLPDAAELRTEEDRAAFVRWFTTIAEAQSTQLDDAWAKIHHDCAGLVRFAYKEALKAHDDVWLQKRRYLPVINHPDVQAVRYPELPFMGELPFSQQGLPYSASVPPDAQFTAAPDARTLWQANSTFISKDVTDARAGDLIFFRVPYGSHTRMHTMIVLGARAGANHRAPGQRVVYHTGARPEEGGEVRKVSFKMLAAHPDADWHPVPDNPRFLGVHRLNLLDFSVQQPTRWALHRPARSEASTGAQR